MKLKSAHIASISTAGVVILCLICSFRYVSPESTLFLFIFNFLFLSFTLGMIGQLRRRLSLLALGNAIALLWSFLLSLIADFGSSLLGETFALFFRILFPFLNSVWLVALWSWCLSAFPKPRGNSSNEGGWS